MVDPASVCSIIPFNMLVILLFVVLILFHEHMQPAWSLDDSSIAIPLAVRSPYLSCWLPQINGTANATSHDAPSTTTSDVTKVRPFS